MTPRRVAGVILLRDDGAALMQHRDDKPRLPHAGLWTPPGGHCNDGESIEACARREMLEETGYRCEALHPLAAFLDDQVQEVPPMWLSMFWAEYDGVQSIVCYEGQGLAFITRDEAVMYPIPSYLVDLWDQALAARARC